MGEGESPTPFAKTTGEAKSLDPDAADDLEQIATYIAQDNRTACPPILERRSIRSTHST
jgi:hypothetical protein